MLELDSLLDLVVAVGVLGVDAVRREVFTFVISITWDPLLTGSVSKTSSQSLPLSSSFNPSQMLPLKWFVITILLLVEISGDDSVTNWSFVGSSLKTQDLVDTRVFLVKCRVGILTIYPSIVLSDFLIFKLCTKQKKHE